MKYYLVFDYEEIAIDIMAQIKAITNRIWDIPNYNTYTNKWWTEDPEGQTPPRFPQVWSITNPYRQELDESWFQNPNPVDPPEYP